MKIILSVFLVSFCLVLHAQDFPYLRNDTLYVHNSIRLYKGQQLELALGKDVRGAFKSIYFPSASSDIEDEDGHVNLSSNWTGKTVTISHFEHIKTRARGFKKYYVFFEEKKIRSYYCDIVTAIALGEIVSDKTDAAIVVLKEQELQKQVYESNDFERQYNYYRKTHGQYPYCDEGVIFLTPKVLYRIGDWVQIGKGNYPNGDFKYISIEKSNSEVVGSKLQITKIKTHGLKSVGLKYYLYLEGKNKVYRCDIDNAMRTGEVIVDDIVIEKSIEKKYSVADEIIKLKQLKDEGILTEEEFNAEKQKILSNQ